MNPEMTESNETTDSCEYESTKKSFLQKLIAIISVSPNAREITSPSGVVKYKDVVDEQGEVREEYESWFRHKIMTILSSKKTA